MYKVLLIIYLEKGLNTDIANHVFIHCSYCIIIHFQQKIDFITIYSVFLLIYRVILVILYKSNFTLKKLIVSLFRNSSKTYTVRYYNQRNRIIDLH